MSTSASAPPRVEIAIWAGAPSAAAQRAHEQRQARAHLWRRKGRRGERLLAHEQRSRRAPVPARWRADEGGNQHDEGGKSREHVRDRHVLPVLANVIWVRLCNLGSFSIAPIRLTPYELAFEGNIAPHI